MRGFVYKHGTARRDLVDAFVYLTRRASVETARRFLKDADATFGRLASMPGTGTRYEPDDPIFADLCVARLSRFKRYLVFNRSIPGGIEVLRVLHGARNIRGILADDLGFGAQGDEGEAEDADEP